MTTYEAHRCGPAPRRLRGLFLKVVRAEIVDDDGVPAIAGRKHGIGWLLGQLWNCTDALPEDDCDALGLPRGSTYAHAARLIRRRDELLDEPDKAVEPYVTGPMRRSTRRRGRSAARPSRRRGGRRERGGGGAMTAEDEARFSEHEGARNGPSP